MLFRSVHEILADRRVGTSGRPFETLRLAVPRTILLEGLDSTVARAFARALDTLSTRGARVEEIDLPLLGEVAAINATGGSRRPRAGPGTGIGSRATKPSTTRASPAASGAARL